MEQQVEVAQQPAMEGDIESLLHPVTSQAEPAVETVAQPVVAPPAPQPVAPLTPAEPQVPLHVLLDERKERQAYQRQIQQFIEAQQRASQPPPPPLDPIGDPEGFARTVLQQNAALHQQMQEQAVHQRANMSEMLARRDHGSEKVDRAVQAAVQAGLNRNFMNQPDPYRALMDWHTAQDIAQQVGPDLKAWEAKKEAEIEARVLERLRTGGVKPAAATPQFLPPSLSSATRASTTPPVVQDASDFFKNRLFAKPQRT